MKSSFQQFSLPLVFVLIANASFLHAAEKPNIVLVMADDQGWGDMAYNGHPDREDARTSMRRPSRASLRPLLRRRTRSVRRRAASVMTGRHPNRMGVFQMGLSDAAAGNHHRRSAEDGRLRDRSLWQMASRLGAARPAPSIRARAASTNGSVRPTSSTTIRYLSDKGNAVQTQRAKVRWSPSMRRSN